MRPLIDAGSRATPSCRSSVPRSKYVRSHTMRSTSKRKAMMSGKSIWRPVAGKPMQGANAWAFSALMCSSTVASRLARRVGSRAISGRGRGDLVVPRRLDAEKIPHEVVPGAAHHVRLGGESVIPVRHDEEVEVLVRLDQLVDHELCRYRMDVVVEGAVGEH